MEPMMTSPISGRFDEFLPRPVLRSKLGERAGVRVLVANQMAHFADRSSSTRLLETPGLAGHENPHPNPPPGYRERERSLRERLLVGQTFLSSTAFHAFGLQQMPGHSGPKSCAIKPSSQARDPRLTPWREPRIDVEKGSSNETGSNKAQLAGGCVSLRAPRPEARALPPTPSRRTRRGRRAFTLIELLVVIGIIAVLAGIILVSVNRVGKAGATTKAKADLQSIATALEAYKQDFGSYPLVTTPNSGAAVLCKALLGPSPKPKTTGPFKRGEFFKSAAPSALMYVALVDSTLPPPVSPAIDSDWARADSRDGADGKYNASLVPPDYEYGENGIRVGPKVIDDQAGDPSDPGYGIPDRPGGRIYGPYVQPEKFKVEKDAGFFVDANGAPILYFTAASAKPNISKKPNYVSGGLLATELSNAALFNANQNIRFFMRNVGTVLESTPEDRGLKRVRAMLGDYSVNGAFDKDGAMETEAAGADTQPFLLWTAGLDGVFGPEVDAVPGVKNLLNLTPADAAGWKNNQRAVQACDDVTNFR